MSNLNEPTPPKSYEFLTSGVARTEGETTWQYNLRKLLTIKSLTSLEADQKKSLLKKCLGPLDLTMVGIGGTIGAGIFVLTGQAAAKHAGPAVVISYLISSFASAFAALSYAELASMIPISGSAYTYAYATMGELMAWIVGWDLILEYLVSTAAVAVGWSSYLVYFIEDAFSRTLNPAYTQSPFIFNSTTSSFESVPGTYFNVPAFVVIVFLTILLVIGIKESSWFNTSIVTFKIFVIILFVLAAAPSVKTENYQPFVPKNEGSFDKFGVSGIFSGASVVFFAYIGFDAVTTVAQETKNPSRDLPIGILGSLLISTILYVAVCLVMTGVVSYTELNTAAPIAVAIRATGMRWLGIIVDLGALAGLTSVILVMIMSQPRIFYTMAKDGLFPAVATKVHPRFKTPYITTAATGVVASLGAAFLPIDVLADLTSVGTLFAFFLVNIGVMILRIKAPHIPRGFRVPGGPFLVPITGAAMNLLLLATCTKHSIERLFIWMAIGLIIYALYGRRNSKANNANNINEKVVEVFEQRKNDQDIVMTEVNEETEVIEINKTNDVVNV
ncbi:4405_t:CDS:2 [Paraglomus brasilianum]|uniref:4405_t:CDS:1 n=1 Tax=Paraglomus brasilianum TaxID=144538 RepID=A0A9N9CTJ9_9GLOM|nr:4405_t:CDS:2 [Paraglomus brasilianum]